MSSIPEKATQCHPPVLNGIYVRICGGEGPSAGMAAANRARLGPVSSVDQMTAWQKPLFKISTTLWLYDGHLCAN
jgi:hypothetical protein